VRNPRRRISLEISEKTLIALEVLRKELGICSRGELIEQIVDNHLEERSPPEPPEPPED